MKSLIIFGLLFNLLGAFYLFYIPYITKYPDNVRSPNWSKTSLDEGKEKLYLKSSKSQKRYFFGWGLMIFGFLLQVIGTIL